MDILKFTFNPFAENTYLLVSNGSGVVIDPGMIDQNEQKIFESAVKEHQIELQDVILTHAHLDHVFGLSYIHKEFGLTAKAHQKSLEVLKLAETASKMYGVPFIHGPEPTDFIDEKNTLEVGGESMDIRFVPGHSPDHLVFIHHEDKQIIAGDTLFDGSIGRTDLPGGNHEQLLSCIQKELYSLGDDYVVHPGHGQTTTIGKEKASNPFVRYQG